MLSMQPRRRLSAEKALQVGRAVFGPTLFRKQKGNPAMNAQGETLERQAEAPITEAGRTRLAVTGGLVGALAASSCCILPLVLFSLGIGGAWIGRLTALAPFQPIFVAVTLACLGYGFWLVYRKRAPCTRSDACARPLPNRIVKLGLWITSVIVAAALAFPLVAPILLGF